MRELIGPRTEVIEAGGGSVVPGFQDAHCHPPQAGNNMLRVWLNDDTGREAYLAHIKQYAADHPDEPFIVGGGWAMEEFPGGTPRKEDLDAIIPDRPVFLFNRDVHGAWVNSKALQVAGIDKDTPDPADGRIERDPRTGEPTGTLHEGAAYSFNDRYVPLPDGHAWEVAILAAQRHLHAMGITGWQDAWVTPATLAAYRALAESDDLTARVVGALWWDRHSGLEQLDQLLDQREHGRAGSFFPTTVKIMTDGVLENFTGALLEPYCDGCGGVTDNAGLTYVDAELLKAAVTMLDEHGFQVHMHAIGDRAVRNCLNAVEAARTANGMNDLRHHIAHIQLMQAEDVPRFAQLGVVANCQPFWAQHEPQMQELTIPFLGERRAQMQYLFATLQRSGATLAMGSDWPVTTANPLREIEVATRRIDPDHRDNAAFLPEQALTLQTALRAFTAGSAYVNHDADGGVLRIAARADLAMLDRDLFADGVLPADATVRATVAAGRVVYRAQ
ncbi:amidohydrolase [Jatrophihabitans cynanchi]|uniref:Amidohydrolase n=1 Tax=Jatrophihabitans cynanchi TaxID=2944128 RepID=A0ABY7K2D5_9ACTN|nr:amidohydrolase [Jatrophihabitans sp. SB3-54]WAX59004.1 amidohydrolase [Jatrophihabitans sp. SB3-54]